MVQPLHRALITRLDTSARFSEVVIHQGGTVFLAGQVPEDSSIGGGISAQCRSVFDQITVHLDRAGSSVDRILTMTIYLTDIRYISEMNAVFEGWMPDGCAPARATVAVSALADPRVGFFSPAARPPPSPSPLLPHPHSHSRAARSG